MKVISTHQDGKQENKTATKSLDTVPLHASPTKTDHRGTFNTKGLPRPCTLNSMTKMQPDKSFLAVY